MLHAPLYSRTYGAIVLYKYCFYLFYCMNFVGKRHLVVLPIPNFWRKLDTVKRLAGHVSTDAFYFSEVNSYAVGNRLLASSAEGMRPKVQRVCFLVNAFTNRTASARKHRATMFFLVYTIHQLVEPDRLFWYFELRRPARQRRPRPPCNCIRTGFGSAVQVRKIISIRFRTVCSRTVCSGETVPDTYCNGWLSTRCIPIDFNGRPQ